MWPATLPPLSWNWPTSWDKIDANETETKRTIMWYLFHFSLAQINCVARYFVCKKSTVFIQRLTEEMHTHTHTHLIYIWWWCVEKKAQSWCKPVVITFTLSTKPTKRARYSSFQSGQEWKVLQKPQTHKKSRHTPTATQM